MKILIKQIMVTLLTVGLLVACNSNPDELHDQTDSGTEETETITNNDEDNESDDGGADTVASEPAIQFDDQMDLSLGDTGQVATTIGAYELTIHSVQKLDQIEGEPSVLDYYLLAEVTVKNIGDTEYEVSDIIGELEQTTSKDGSGSSDISSQFETIDSLVGNLQPNDEITGEILFDVQGTGEQYIRINSGLIAAGAVFNEVIWTFEQEEMNESE